MQRCGAALLVLLAIAAADDLDGEIKGGKAGKLVEKAKPLLDKAFEQRKRLLFFEDKQSDAYRDLLKDCIANYDKGSMLLVDALEIRYDGGVNNMLLRASRDLAKSRAALFQFENRRRWLEEQKRAEADPGADSPAPEKKEPPAEPEPEAEPAKPEPPRFEEHQPPALPRDVRPRSVTADPPADADAWMRSEKRGIEKTIKEYYGARRKGKLRTRCKLCAGKGAYRDGTPCEACAGSGDQINLYYFRKVYWNGFTPLLRAAPDAFRTLQRFLAHAKAHPDTLAEEVASFRILEIEPHEAWARARVQVKTAQGEREEALTLVSIGSTWYFFQPATDEELLWGK